MKIYFCGSITGGRQDQPVYAKLIAHLQEKWGEVPTDHVGDPALTQSGQEDTPERIYARDLAWLEGSDAVVAEVTVPSHGVGIELSHAESLGKPVLCLFRRQPERPVSPFISGNPYFHLETYDDVEDAYALIDRFLEGLSSVHK